MLHVTSIRGDTEALQAINGRGLDLAVGDFGATAPSRLKRIPLYQDPFVTVAWLGNTRLAARTLPLDAFLDLPHLRVGEDDAVDEQLAARGLHRRVDVIEPSFMQAAELLVGTQLLLTVPSSVARAREDLLGHLRFFKPPLPLRKPRSWPWRLRDRRPIHCCRRLAGRWCGSAARSPRPHAGRSRTKAMRLIPEAGFRRWRSAMRPAAERHGSRPGPRRSARGRPRTARRT